jgi:hypothetical protein
MTAISVRTIGLTPVANYGVSTKIAHTGFLNRIIPGEPSSGGFKWYRGRLGYRIVVLEDGVSSETG